MNAAAGARICVLANPKSGRNSRDRDAIARAMAVFGPHATLRHWRSGEDLDVVVRRLVAEGFQTIVAAGGDGTVTGVAHALLGTRVALGVLPLGTFNFFARGLHLPEDPEGAAQAILGGQVRRISVGTVNGQVFLNNASLGIYPRILQAREESYARWGRSRLLAYWTVLKTLVRYQAARRVIVTVEGQTRNLRSPLIFVARSAYQLQRFGLTGGKAISDDRFAVFIALGGTRWHLLKLALHLALGRVIPGQDVEVLTTRQMEVRTAKRRPNVAFDGEKRRMLAPLLFEIQPDALSIILPAEKAEMPKGSA
mgnify:CR=1 FL=1